MTNITIIHASYRPNSHCVGFKSGLISIHTDIHSAPSGSFFFHEGSVVGSTLTVATPKAELSGEILSAETAIVEGRIATVLRVNIESSGSMTYSCVRIAPTSFRYERAS